MFDRFLRNLRRRLADADSLLHLSTLGVLSGISCALVMLAFRFAIEIPSSLWLPDNNPENFQSLPRWLHFFLPLSGALVLGLIMRSMAAANTRVGVPHVITRLHAHHGQMPLKNALLQFFGGALAIASGQSGGREGPAIHLGAAANSLLGQRLLLPNNSLRVLVGCGTAAAIAASFNTPIAGVIFAMEVVMMEYSVAGFIPVMLAAITSTALTRAIYGSGVLFAIPTIEMNTLWELPYIVFAGLVVGCAAALFMKILKLALSFSDRPVLQRMLIAGLATGCCALWVPEVLGIGYDSLSGALASELSLTLMLALIATKLIATAISAGMGMPIGIIGPSLLIGACIGGALGALAETLFPELTSHHSFYVMLGMGAMMGAVLNAPLAALMALLELTGNTDIIFPGMLAITVASLTNSELFKQRSAHQTVLRHIKQLLPTDPVSLALQRTSVASAMQRDLTTSENLLSAQLARELLSASSQWFVIAENQDLYLLSKQELAAGLEPALIDRDSEDIDILTVCHRAHSLAPLHIQATLREALDCMNENEVDALFVSGYISGPYPDHGLITRSDIERHFNTPQ